MAGLWRDNGWCLGNAASRKKVMHDMLSEVHKPDDALNAKLASRQTETASKLSVPRIVCTSHASEMTHFYTTADATEPEYVLPPLEPLVVTKFLEDVAKVTWKGKAGFVKTEQLHGVKRRSASQMAYLQARQGECWRRKGTRTDDVLLKADVINKSSKFPHGRFWLYDSYHLTKQAIDKLFIGSTKDVTQTLAYTHLKKILNKIIKKSQKECPDKFGILLDVITTNSLIQTGMPLFSKTPQSNKHRNPS